MVSFRPPRGSLPVKKRYQGTRALDRMKFRRYHRIARLLAITSSALHVLRRKNRKLILLTVLVYYHCRKMSLWDNIPPNIVQRTNLRFEDLTEFECDHDYRFLKEHLPLLKQCLRIPEFFVLRNGIKINGEEALLITLFRFSYPVRLVSMEAKFGREHSQLSRIFNHTVTYVVQQLGHLLTVDTQAHLFVPKLAHFNNAIRLKLLDVHGRVPNRESLTAVFLDATLRRVSRPSDTLRLGNASLQRCIYNGRKKVHCLSYQGVSGPDGIIWDLFGPIPGRHQDKFVLGRSGFNGRFSNIQLGNPVEYHAYTDKGYEDLSHVHAAYHAYPGHPTLPWQDEDNLVMRTARGTGAEWPFGKVINNFRYIDFHKGQQIQLHAVGTFYKFAVLLTNAHSMVTPRVNFLVLCHLH